MKGSWGEMWLGICGSVRVPAESHVEATDKGAVQLQWRSKQFGDTNIMVQLPGQQLMWGEDSCVCSGWLSMHCGPLVSPRSSEDHYWVPDVWHWHSQFWTLLNLIFTVFWFFPFGIQKHLNCFLIEFHRYEISHFKEMWLFCRDFGAQERWWRFLSDLENDRETLIF